MVQLVSVVVPAYQAVDSLPELMESIWRQTVVPQEIIVVDDHSSDNTEELARELGATVVRLSKNGGPGPARNAGVEMASGEILMFTDADCVVPRDWIEVALAFMKKYDVEATTSGYIGPVDNNLTSLFQHWEKRSREPVEPRPIGATNGHSLAIDKKLYQRVGGMPNIRTSEDYLFGIRLSFISTVIFDPNNGVYHKFRSGIIGYFRQKYLFAKNSALCIRENNSSSRATATFSSYRVLWEMLLTLLAIGVVFYSIWITLVLLAMRVVPFWIYLSKQQREKVPFALFLYSIPMLIVRDVASLVGMFWALILFRVGNRIQ
jgi:glycosyltransferase involved in cell wall biosynthesis